ncbi:MAG: zinc ABC transporter substrate-binding protein, partial [Synergistaceae bacterium]|nr:zinc ABC transporter substrate-binding protein [Synergistaceae bacterium]
MRLKTLIFLAILSLITSSAEAGLKITCSLFPVYDFARAVTGGSANVHLLLKPGTEPHEYEPSPMD